MDEVEIADGTTETLGRMGDTKIEIADARKELIMNRESEINGNEWMLKIIATDSLNVHGEKKTDGFNHGPFDCVIPPHRAQH